MVVDMVCVFFKQKTAYEICYGLVGAEMFIRDRYFYISPNATPWAATIGFGPGYEP